MVPATHDAVAFHGTSASLTIAMSHVSLGSIPPHTVQTPWPNLMAHVLVAVPD